MPADRPDPGVLHPVILSVPESRTALSGRRQVEYLSRMARQAASRSAGLSGMVLDQFPKDDRGTPLACRGVCWSLSHKPQKVAGVVARSPVGIDLEKVRPVHPGLFRRIASEKEWRLVGARDLTALFMVWTAKEAVLKATGRGLAGLSRCRIKEVHSGRGLILEAGRTCWNVEHCTIGGGFMAAVTAAGKNAVIWHVER